MRKRTRRWWNILGKLWDSIMDRAEDSVPDESSLRSDAEGMLNTLELKAEVVSYKMALADDAREKLEKEIANHDSLKQEAERALRDQHHDIAERCAALMVHSAKRLKELELLYKSRQGEAEQVVAEFTKMNAEVRERVSRLPQLQADVRMVKADQELARLQDTYTLDSAKSSFDRTEEQIRIKKFQLQNRALIEADPNAELDQQIRKSIESREITEILRGLEAKIQAEQGVIEAEVIKEDVSSSARKLLEAPRYQGIPLARRNITEKSGVRER